MRGALDRAMICAVIGILAMASDTLAQSAGSDAPPGLPPVIESLGSGDPPDLPPSAGSTPGSAVDDVKAPYLQKPVDGPKAGVLDTLDNLPPVGVPGSAAPRPADLPELPTDDPAPSAPKPADSQPRIVRFGDIRTESAARQQYPELRSRTAANGRDKNGSIPQGVKTEVPEQKPRGILARLMPWRRQPQAEPPFLTRGIDEKPARAAGESETNSLPGTRSRALLDRIDQELQKKADRAARQAVGSRTNELDVQVIDEEIYLRARPMWFWQRRQITDELRNLPGFDPKRLHVTVY